MADEEQIQMNMYMKAFAKNLKTAWLSSKQISLSVDDFKLKLEHQPYPICVIDNFLPMSEIFGNNLLSELDNIYYRKKERDIFRFHQSMDLKSISKSKSCIHEVCKFFASDMRKWIIKSTGKTVVTNVDISCSRYNFQDYLLCHNDLGDDHAIAFVWYLTKEWNPEYGGSFDMFNHKGNGIAEKVVQKYYPAWNRLIFFEVSPTSFHQVSEILKEDQVRISINGWYNWRPSAPVENIQIEYEIVNAFVHNEDTEFLQYIDPRYLDVEWIKYEARIDAKFERESCIMLPDFFRPEIVKQMEEEIISNNITWVTTENKHDRNFEVAQRPYDEPPAEIGPILHNLVHLFLSNQFCKILNSITGLEITASPDSNMPPDVRKECKNHSYANVEIRRYKPGSYSFIRDFDTSRLFATFYLLPPADCEENGGTTMYLDKETMEELFEETPTRNSLTLVYTESDCTNYFKYRSLLATDTFYAICVTYNENEKVKEGVDKLEVIIVDSETEEAEGSTGQISDDGEAEQDNDNDAEEQVVEDETSEEETTLRDQVIPVCQEFDESEDSDDYVEPTYEMMTDEEEEKEEDVEPEEYVVAEEEDDDEQEEQVEQEESDEQQEESVEQQEESVEQEEENVEEEEENVEIEEENVELEEEYEEQVSPCLCDSTSDENNDPNPQRQIQARQHTFDHEEIDYITIDSDDD